MLVDKYGREISYLRISITDKCNLRCRYCMPEEGHPRVSHQKLLRVEEIFRVVRLFNELGIDKLRLTGGEPLVHKGLLGLIDDLTTLDIKDLSLTTNGILLPKYAEKLVEKGIRRVNISLDTLDGEKFDWVTRGGKVDEVMAGIDAAIAAGMEPIKLNMVVVKGFNDHEVWDMVQLVKDKPLHLRFIELMPIGDDGDFWTDDNFVASEDTKKLLEDKGLVLEPKQIKGNGPAEVFAIEGYAGTVGFIHAVSQHFCNKCNRIRMTSDGKIYPCLHSDKFVDILTPIREGKTDLEMKDILLEAVHAKPERSVLGDQTHCMFTIGG